MSIFLDKYVSDLVKTKKEENYNTEPFINENKTIVAIDNSGSTSGSVLRNTKQVVNDLIESRIMKNNIYAWNSHCTIQNLEEIRSTGGTRPETIFPYINNAIQNILITTDGKIGDIGPTKRELVRHLHVKNIIAILFSSMGVVCNLNISVFYPFLEHSKKVGGTFLLLCYHEHELYLLMKNIPEKVEDNLPACVEEFNFDVKWENINKVTPELIKNVKVLSYYAKITDLEKGEIFYPKSKTKIIKLSNLEKDFNKEFDFEKHNSDFLNFMKENGLQIIQEIKYLDDENNFNIYRNILNEWKKKTIKYKNDKSNIILNSELNKKFEELYKKRLSLSREDPEYEPTKIAIQKLNSELNEKLETEIINQTLSTISDIMENLTQIQNQKIQSYTLKDITGFANRAKRAQKVIVPTEISVWDLSGDIIKTKKCPICANENLPCALLMIDIEKEYPDLYKFNCSDVALNNEFYMGMQNKVAIPCGEFCLDCAKNLLSLGKHPLTLQKLSSYIVLFDPKKTKNYGKLADVMCVSLFGGLRVTGSLQILLGLFDSLEQHNFIEKNNQKRFQPEIFDWIKEVTLFHCKGNLLPQGFSESKLLIEAAYDLIFYEVKKLNMDTWLVPITNKTMESMSLITRCLLLKYKKLTKKIDDENLIINCANIMKRLFIKILIDDISWLCKERASKKSIKFVEKYVNVFDAMKSDLFNMENGVPLLDSQKLVSLENSQMLKNLYEKKEYEDMVYGIKFFDYTMNNVFYKDSEKKFELISENIMTIITLCFYNIFSEKDGFQLLCKKEDDLIKYFIDFENQKKLEKENLEKTKNKYLEKKKERKTGNFRNKKRTNKMYIRGRRGRPLKPWMTNSNQEREENEEQKEKTKQKENEEQKEKTKQKIKNEIKEIKENNNLLFLPEKKAEIIKYFEKIFFFSDKNNSNIITKEKLLELIKSFSPYEKYDSKLDELTIKHINFTAHYASHLYSPAVTQCCVCAESFIKDDEIEILKKEKDEKKIDEIINKIKERRNEHISKYYKVTYDNNNTPIDNGLLVPCHEIVRTVCNYNENLNLQKPTRKLLEQEIYYANKKTKNKGGVFGENFIKKLICISLEYLERRKSMEKAENKIITFKDRVLIEINQSQKEFIGNELTMEKLSKEEIDELTKPFDLKEVNQDYMKQMEKNINKRITNIENFYNKGGKPRVRMGEKYKTQRQIIRGKWVAVNYMNNTNVKIRKNKKHFFNEGKIEGDIQNLNNNLNNNRFNNHFNNPNNNRFGNFNNNHFNNPNNNLNNNLFGNLNNNYDDDSYDDEYIEDPYDYLDDNYIG